MAKYVLTNKAVEDLSAIWEYTCKAWSERGADKYYELLTGSFEELTQNPDLGKSYAEINEDIMGFRIGKHIIFYRVIQSGDLEIIRILHQRMDLKSRLEE